MKVSGKTFLVLLLLSAMVSAQTREVSLLQGLEEHSGLVLLIASTVIIIMMILILFYLHSIDEHLNWIRRIR